MYDAFASPGVAVALGIHLFIITAFLSVERVPQSVSILLKWVLVARGIQLLFAGVLLFTTMYKMNKAASTMLEVLSFQRVLLVSDTAFAPLRFLHRKWQATTCQALLVTIACILRLVEFNRGILLLLIIGNSFASIVFMFNCMLDLSLLHTALALSNVIELFAGVFIGCYIQAAIFIVFAVWIFKCPPY